MPPTVSGATRATVLCRAAPPRRAAPRSPRLHLTRRPPPPYPHLAGVIHLIDTVLIPHAIAEGLEERVAAWSSETYDVDAPAVPNIVQIAVADPDLSTLVAALTKANLVTTLEGAGPFTVFAPTNEAFAALPAWNQVALRKKARLHV